MSDSKNMGILIGFMGIALGWWLAQPAQALPQPSSVSTGSNPYFALAGQLSYGSSASLGGPPLGSDWVLTDVVLTTASLCGPNGFDVTLTSSSGAVLGKFRLSSQYATQSGNYQSNVVVNFSSGLPIPNGETLTISTNSSYSDCYTNYTLSGYQAHP